MRKLSVTEKICTIIYQFFWWMYWHRRVPNKEDWKVIFDVYD